MTSVRRCFAAAVLLLVLTGCAGSPSGTAPAPVIAEATAAVTAEPTADPIVGSGTIEFGKKVTDDLTIVGPADTFKTKAKEIAWVAHLSAPAGATSLTFILSSKGKGGTEKTIVKTDQDVASPDFDTVGSSGDLATLVGNKPGTYVMRYLREGDVLAEGEFKLVK